MSACKMGNQHVRLGLVEPHAVGHGRVDIDTIMWRQYGAVRSPFGRLTPNAAHKRSDRICGGRRRSEYSRVECLDLSASVKGFPPALLGGGNAICVRAWAGLLEAAAVAAPARMAAFACRRFIASFSIPVAPQSERTSLTCDQQCAMREFSEMRKCTYWNRGVLE